MADVRACVRVCRGLEMRGGEKGEPWTEVLSWEPRAFLYHNFLVSFFFALFLVLFWFLGGTNRACWMICSFYDAISLHCLMRSSVFFFQVQITL